MFQGVNLKLPQESLDSVNLIPRFIIVGGSSGEAQAWINFPDICKQFLAQSAPAATWPEECRVSWGCPELQDFPVPMVLLLTGGWSLTNRICSSLLQVCQWLLMTLRSPGISGDLSCQVTQGLLPLGETFQEELYSFALTQVYKPRFHQLSTDWIYFYLLHWRFVTCC